MITILKEAEVKGAVEFIPSAENLKELSDAALTMTAENAEDIDLLQKSIDTLLVLVAELSEAQDADKKTTSEPTASKEPEKPVEDEKGDDTNVEGENQNVCFNSIQKIKNY